MTKKFFIFLASTFLMISSSAFSQEFQTPGGVDEPFYQAPSFDDAVVHAYGSESAHCRVFLEESYFTDSITVTHECYCSDGRVRYQARAFNYKWMSDLYGYIMADKLYLLCGERA